MNRNKLMKLAGWRRVGWNSPHHKLKPHFNQGYWIRTKEDDIFGEIDDVTAYTSSFFKRNYFREKPFEFYNWIDVYRIIKRINHTDNEEIKNSLYKADIEETLTLIEKYYGN